ncbi:MAG: nicotianamine synthase family protein [Pseudonocardiaceae bacterium]
MKSIDSATKRVFEPARSAQDAEIVISRFWGLYKQLAAAPSVEPSDYVTKLFAEVVELCISQQPDAVVERVLRDPRTVELRPRFCRLCADHIFREERAWSRRISISSDPWAELFNCPNYCNYIQLCDVEIHSVLALTSRTPKRLLFAGSGPVPITSVLFAHRFQLTVDNLEVDTEAFELGRHLVQQLGKAESMGFIHCDLRDFIGLEPYDVVCLAALVGLSPEEKREITAHLSRHMRPDALLLVRSAHGLRSLIYPPVSVEDLVGFVPQLVLRPYTTVMNSVLIAKPNNAEAPP